MENPLLRPPRKWFASAFGTAATIKPPTTTAIKRSFLAIVSLLIMLS
jgi:hypothetical protein